MLELMHQSGGYNDALSHNNISVMKEMMVANTQQQESLSKMMEQYDSQRLACIDKYIGWFLHTRHFYFFSFCCSKNDLNRSILYA